MRTATLARASGERERTDEAESLAIHDRRKGAEGRLRQSKCQQVMKRGKAREHVQPVCLNQLLAAI